MSRRFGLCAWLAPALIPGWAFAHPVDEVVQGAYLTLAPGQVRLELDLTPGTEVADTVLRTIDANGDRQLSDAEARGFGERVLKQSTISLNGKPVVWRFDRASMPSYDEVKEATPTIKVYATAPRPEGKGARTLGYENRYQPAKSQWNANIFLQPSGGWRYRVTGQQHTNDGRALTVSYTGERR